MPQLLQHLTGQQTKKKERKEKASQPRTRVATQPHTHIRDSLATARTGKTALLLTTNSKLGKDRWSCIGQGILRHKLQHAQLRFAVPRLTKPRLLPRTTPVQRTHPLVFFLWPPQLNLPIHPIHFTSVWHHRCASSSPPSRFGNVLLTIIWCHCKCSQLSLQTVADTTTASCCHQDGFTCLSNEEEEEEEEEEEKAREEGNSAGTGAD